jgi:hypothetical protein
MAYGDVVCACSLGKVRWRGHDECQAGRGFAVIHARDAAHCVDAGSAATCLFWERPKAPKAPHRIAAPQPHLLDVGLVEGVQNLAFPELRDAHGPVQRACTEERQRNKGNRNHAVRRPGERRASTSSSPSSQNNNHPSGRRTAAAPAYSLAIALLVQVTHPSLPAACCGARPLTRCRPCGTGSPGTGAGTCRPWGSTRGRCGRARP